MKKKEIIGIMASSFLMMSFLAPNSSLAEIAASFPDVPLQVIQMITTIPSLIGVAVALIVGRLTAYIHKRSLIIGGVVTYLAGGMLSYLLHNSIGGILLGACVLGIGLGIMLTCIPALICDCFSVAVRSRLMGIQAAFISGGGMVFLWLGGKLAAVQWSHCFWAYLLSSVILVIDLICLPKGKLDVRQRISKNFLTGKVWYYAILGFWVYVFINVYHSNISLLIEIRQLGGTIQASYASMCYTFAGMIAGCITGALIQRVKEYIFPMSIGLALLGMLISYYGNSLILLCIGGALCGMAFSSFTPAGNFYSAESADDSNRAFSIAMYTSVSNMGQAVSPLLIAMIMHAQTIEGRFLGAAVNFVFLGVISVLVARRMLLCSRDNKE